MKPTQSAEDEAYCSMKADTTSMDTAVDGRKLPCPGITSGECLDSPSMTPLSFYNEPMHQLSPLRQSKQRYSCSTYEFDCYTRHCKLNDESEPSNFQAPPLTMSSNYNIRPQSIVPSGYVFPNLANMHALQNNGLQFASLGTKDSPFVPYGQYDSEFYRSGSTLRDAMKTSIHRQNLPQVEKYDTAKHSKKEIDKKPLKTLSAYNFFFRHERERIIAGNDDHDGDYSFARKEALLYDHWFRDRSKKRSHRKSHGKVSFASLSRTVAQRWKELPEHRKQFYQDLAAEDLRRYRHELMHREFGSNMPHISSLKMCPEAQVQDIVFKASNFFDVTPIPEIDERYNY